MTSHKEEISCLITGASGFIGSGVLDYLLKKTDWKFTAICSWRHGGNALNIEPHSRLKVITHDLTGPLPDLGDFDFILNFASESHTDKSIADPVPIVENNISITLQLLEYSRKHKPKVFIQFSTTEVYGPYAHGEWDIMLPGNPYAASKGSQELLCISYWRTYQLPIVITNSNNIVGPNQNPKNFVPKLIDLIKRGEEVEIYQTNGTPGKRCYIPIQNVADALVFILSHAPARFPKAQRPDRYNLPGGTEMDNLEMAQLIADILGEPLKYKFVDANAARPGYDQFYPKTDGRLMEMGWLPPLSLMEGLQWIKRM